MVLEKRQFISTLNKEGYNILYLKGDKPTEDEYYTILKWDPEFDSITRTLQSFHLTGIDLEPLMLNFNVMERIKIDISILTLEIEKLRKVKMEFCSHLNWRIFYSKT